MNCTPEERENCNAEKLGCEGCFYNEDFVKELMKEINRKKYESVSLKPLKIKMKEEFYDKLAIECQKLVTRFSEVLDKSNQPLNTFYGLRIEIDNRIASDYKIVFDELEEDNGE